MTTKAAKTKAAAKPLRGRALAVAIAKDVLARLKAGKLSPKRENGYLEVKKHLYEISWPDTGEELQPHIGKIAKQCDVCAIGSLFLSKVALTGNFKARAGDYWTTFMNAETMFRVLRQAFSKTDLANIDTAFESNYHACEAPDFPPSERARWLSVNQFAKTHGSNPKTRLKAICNNIIANNGRFIVPLVKEAKRG